jgi:hypothetical protein
VNYLAGAAGRLCNSGFVEPAWLKWGNQVFQGLDDRVAAGCEKHLCHLNELAAKELEMLIDGSDESTSGQVGDDKADVTDMVSVRMGGLEPKSKGGKEEESDDAEDELAEEDSSKPKAKGKGRAKRMPKERISTTTSLPITMIRQGKVSSYQTAESVQVCHIPLAR